MFGQCEPHIELHVFATTYYNIHLVLIFIFPVPLPIKVLDEQWNAKKNHVKEIYQSNPYYSRLLITVIYQDSTKILNTVVEYSLSVVHAFIIINYILLT